MTLALVAAVVSFGEAGCGKGEGDGGSSQNADNVAAGSKIYAAQCARCHGGKGEGGTGPSLRNEQKSEADLVGIVSATMPADQNTKCAGDCATAVVEYILATFKGALQCDAPAPLPRGLRLLTTREYRNTVKDLLGVGAVSGGAAATPCGLQTFTFDPKGSSYNTVHVAGSFNGWSQTVAGGGWPMAKSGNVWTLQHQLPNGQSTYKFVLNESQWVTDTATPLTAPDGVGGQNSVVNTSCPSGGAGASGGATTLDPAAAFPPDTRPEGFAFDDHGPGRVVTSDLMDAYLGAASAIAKAADLSKIVTCDPAADKAGCAKAVVISLGMRAFRRPLSAAEIARYTAVITTPQDWETGARAGIAALLVAPSFLYRSEVGEKQPDGTYRLTAWETATALSYLYWGSMPDQELFDVAKGGGLASAPGVEKQARRLLASPRARETVGAFAVQWLGAEPVTSVNKADAAGFSPDMRAAMLEETRQFVTHVVFDGTHRSDELFTANYTFANQMLAGVYGIPGVTGTDLKKVSYPDGTRSGLLGQGSMLATTALSDQTSPIRRGLFVRRRLLCQEFGTPPPNAGSIPAVDPKATTRDRFAQHTANPFCKSCHQYIDQVGFGFERFDVIGRARTEEAGKPIDSSGDMNDVEGFGTNTHAPFATLADLGQTLAKSDAAKTCVVRQVYRFARGQKEKDICAVSDLKQRFTESGSNLQELLVSVALTPDFQVRR
jgi:hypothetical protein